MSLRLCCFASGSKGNCCYVSDGSTDILIDLGIAATRAEHYLSAIGADPDGVNVLLTHSHSDHIGGVRVFCKKHINAKVFCQNESARAIAVQTGVAPNVIGREFALGGITVNAVPVPHDVPCFGYVIKSGNRSVAVVTDIGTVKSELLGKLRECDLVMLESNHDVTRLKNNATYSPQLKERIASSKGHLSNADCAEACAFLAEHGVRSFVLAHLSQDNNDAACAIDAVNSGLYAAGIRDARVVAAMQDKPTGLFEIC